MATNRQVSFTLLELKALLLRAEIGCRTPCPEIDRDSLLAEAGERALEKLHRANLGMGRKPTPPINPVRGAEIDLRRKSA